MVRRGTMLGPPWSFHSRCNPVGGVPLSTHDGDLLTMAYQGFRSGPPDVLAKVARGETFDADSYYYRVAGFFETASHKLARLNTLVVVAKGWRTPTGPGYDVFEVL